MLKYRIGCGTVVIALTGPAILKFVVGTEPSLTHNTKTIQLPSQKVQPISNYHHHWNLQELFVGNTNVCPEAIYQTQIPKQFGRK